MHYKQAIFAVFLLIALHLFTCRPLSTCLTDEDCSNGHHCIKGACINDKSEQENPHQPPSELEQEGDEKPEVNIGDSSETTTEYRTEPPKEYPPLRETRGDFRVVNISGFGGKYLDHGKVIVSGPKDGFFLAGTYQHKTTIAGKVLESSRSEPFFIAYLDAKKNTQWVIETHAIDAFDMTSDPSGNLYLFGVSLGSEMLTKRIKPGFFVAKINTFGLLDWLVEIPTVAMTRTAESYQKIIYRNQRLFLSMGIRKGELTINRRKYENKSGWNHLVLASLDDNGKYVWHKTLGGLELAVDWSTIDVSEDGRFLYLFAGTRYTDDKNRVQPYQHSFAGTTLDYKRGKTYQDFLIKIELKTFQARWSAPLLSNTLHISEYHVRFVKLRGSHVYICGAFEEGLVIQEKKSFQSMGHKDIYIASFSRKDGVLAGIASIGTKHLTDEPTAFDIGDDGSVYVGALLGSISTGDIYINGRLVLEVPYVSLENHAFLLKIEGMNSKPRLSWHHKFSFYSKDFTSSELRDRFLSIFINKNGELFGLGSFFGTANKSINPIDSKGLSDIFLFHASYK